MSEIELALEALFFGSAWYFGILVVILLVICIMKTWKYAGALIIPMVIAMEVQYFNRIEETPDFIWCMICLLFLIIGISVYSINIFKKGSGF